MSTCVVADWYEWSGASGLPEFVCVHPLTGSEIDCADKFGNTPLHVAARYGHELLISTLMTNGADTAR